ncbi:MAG: hypothetical protein U0236_16225 [Nitrospira sp.]
MRWFNLVGFGMLTLGIYFDAWIYLYAWERFNIVLMALSAMYLIVALGLSLWGGSNRE